MGHGGFQDGPASHFDLSGQELWQGMVIWLTHRWHQEPLPHGPLADLLLCRRLGERDVTPTWVAARTDQWRLVWPLLRQSFHAGESILIHCKVGRHRGAAIGTLTRAILAQETIEESDRWIRDRRDTELEKVVNQHNVGAWLQEMRRQSVLSDPLPPITGFCSTARSHCHLQTGDGIPLCSHKQSLQNVYKGPFPPPEWKKLVHGAALYVGHVWAKPPPLGS